MNPANPLSPLNPMSPLHPNNQTAPSATKTETTKDSGPTEVYDVSSAEAMGFGVVMGLVVLVAIILWRMGSGR